MISSLLKCVCALGSDVLGFGCDVEFTKFMIILGVDVCEEWSYIGGKCIYLINSKSIFERYYLYVK